MSFYLFMYLLFVFCLGLLFRSRIIYWLDQITYGIRAPYIFRKVFGVPLDRNPQLRLNITKTLINPDLYVGAQHLRKAFSRETELLKKIKEGEIDYPESAQQLTSIRDEIRSAKIRFYRKLECAKRLGFPVLNEPLDYDKEDFLVNQKLGI